MASSEQWKERLSADPFSQSRNSALELLPPFLSSGGRGADSVEAYRSHQIPSPKKLVQEVNIKAEVCASERELLAEQKRGKTAALTGALISRSYYVAAEEDFKQQALQLKRERKKLRRRETQLLAKPQMIQSEPHRKRCERFQSVLTVASEQLQQWKREIANLQNHDCARSHAQHASPGARKVPHLPIWLLQAEKEVDDGEQALYDLNFDQFREQISTMSTALHRKDRIGKVANVQGISFSPEERQSANIGDINEMIRLVSARLDEGSDTEISLASAEGISFLAQKRQSEIIGEAQCQNNLDNNFNVSRGEHIVTKPTRVEKLDERIRLFSDFQQSAGECNDFYRDDFVVEKPTCKENINDRTFFVDQHLDDGSYAGTMPGNAQLQQSIHTNYDSLTDERVIEEPTRIENISDMTQLVSDRLNDGSNAETCLGNTQFQQSLNRQNNLRCEEVFAEPTYKENINDMTLFADDGLDGGSYAGTMLGNAQLQQSIHKNYDFLKDERAIEEPTRLENISDMTQLVRDRLSDGSNAETMLGNTQFRQSLNRTRIDTIDGMIQIDSGNLNDGGYCSPRSNGQSRREGFRELTNQRQVGSDHLSTKELQFHDEYPKTLGTAASFDKTLELRSSLNNLWDAGAKRIQEDPKELNVAETSSTLSSARSGMRGSFVDLFALAPSQNERKHSEVDWVVSLELPDMEPVEPITQQSIEHKVVTSTAGLYENSYEESYRTVFTWNAWEQSIEQTKRAANWKYIDSPEFTLSGEDGLYLRYWPHWDVANEQACLRVFGPPGFRGHCRLGIGDACLRDVEINQEATGQSASQVWFFAKSETKFTRNLEDVWVAEPDYY